MSVQSARSLAARMAGPAGVEAPDRTNHTMLIGVFVCALGCRIWLLLSVYGWPLVYEPSLDGLEYLTWAKRIAGGNFAWPVPTPHSPGYPIILAILLVVTGHSLFHVLLIQSAVGALSCVQLARIGGRWLQRPSGMLAGAFLALYGPVMVLDTQVLAEPFLTFFLLTAVNLLLSHGRRTTLAAGLNLGVATIVRPTAAVVIPIALVWLARQRSGWWRTAPFVLGVCAVVGPMAITNRIVSGAWQLQGHVAMNLYIGNSPLGTGTASARLGHGYEWLRDEATRHNHSGPSSEDRYYVLKTIAEVNKHPTAWLRLLGDKILWSIRNEEIRDSHSYYWFVEVVPSTKYLLTLGIIFPLAVIGIVANARHAEDVSWVLLAVLCALWFTVILMVVGSRYRAPLVPFLCLYACAGLIRLLTDLRVTPWRTAALLCLATTAAILSNTGTHHKSRQTAEEWALMGNWHLRSGRAGEADALFRRALERDPQNGLAWTGLGRLSYGDGRLEAAADAAARALQVDERNPRAHELMAAVAASRRDVDRAIWHLKAAVETSPRHYRFRKELSTRLFEAGRYAEARVHLELLAKAHSADRQILRMLQEVRHR